MSPMRFLLFLGLLFSSGCSLTSTLFPSLPESRQLVELSDAELFAVRPDGEMLAYVADGLNILRLTDRYQQRLTYDSPEALIWAPDGRSLVAAFREAEKTRLVRLTSTAAERSQVLVDEQITDLAWLTDGRLLAMAQTVEKKDDVVLIRASLLIWDSRWDVERIPLYRKRFRSRAAAGKLVVQHHFDLSPLKDELVYNRYLDLPTADGRSELILYNLLSGKERFLTETGNRQTAAFLAADAETLLLPVGHRQVQYMNPWKKEVLSSWQTPGEFLQVAPHSALFFVDGKVYANGRLQLTLPFGSKGRFSEDGARLFVAWRRKLYLYDDYEVPEQIQFSGVEKARLQRIRQQRSRGEISIHDYYQARNNILNP